MGKVENSGGGEQGLPARAAAFMRERAMLTRGDRVIAAVSGGADSVCLLLVLACLAPEFGFSLRVVHVHHGLRGEEADADEAFAAALAGRLSLPFRSVRVDAAAYAKKNRLSIEEAGRILRRRVFAAAAEDWAVETDTAWQSDPCRADFEAAEKDRPGEATVRSAAGGVKIALAHHAEDSVETILFNLLRGSGLAGLSGIAPVRGPFVRPLLFLTKAEIMDWLRTEGQDWREDASNASADYARNRIRLSLIPQMQEQVNAGAVEHILKAGRIIGQADAYFRRRTEEIWAVQGRLETADTLPVASFPRAVFQKEEEPVRTLLVRLLLEKARISPRDVTASHYEEMVRTALSGGRTGLPGGAAVWTEYGRFCAGFWQPERAPRLSGCTAAVPPGKAAGLFVPAVPAGASAPDALSARLSFSVFPYEPGTEIPRNRCKKWFDYDKMNKALSIRFRQAGDYILLAGGRKKTVARFMIDEKIPRRQRDWVPLLAEGSHVLWIVGYRISEYYKITEETKTVLQAVWEEENNHGG